MCGLISVLQVSRGDFDLSNERAPGNHEKTERERVRRRFCDQCCRVYVKADGTVLGVILFRLSQNSILMNEISETILNEELNKQFLVKIQFSEN